MKRALLIFLSMVGFTSVLWFGVAQAADIRTGQSPNIAKKETVDSTVYIAGESVIIEGTVQGDVFCAGEKVEITGTVEGDVICAGQNLTISGKVNGDVRSAGQTVAIKGDVDGSVTLAGQNVSLEPNARIGRDLTLFAESAQLSGQIGRDILGGADKLTLLGQVGRHINFEATDLKLEKDARIGGDLNYTSEFEATVAEGALIAGATERTTPEVKTTSTNEYIAGILIGFGSLLFIGLALLLLAPRLLDSVGQGIRQYNVWAIGAGALALLVMPMVALILLFTVVGLPLAFLLIFLWLSALITSAVFAANSLGQVVIQKLKWQGSLSRLTSLGFGLLVLFLVTLIPVVGAFVMLVAIIWGMGGIVLVVGRQLRATPATVAAKTTKAKTEVKGGK